MVWLINCQSTSLTSAIAAVKGRIINTDTSTIFHISHNRSAAALGITGNEQTIRDRKCADAVGANGSAAVTGIGFSHRLRTAFYKAAAGDCDRIIARSSYVYCAAIACVSVSIAICGCASGKDDAGIVLIFTAIDDQVF